MLARSDSRQKALLVGLALGVSALVVALLVLTFSSPASLAAQQATEQVNLVGGRCSPTASTFPNNTPPATIADNLSPQQGDDTIWRYFAAEDRYRGWRRDVPTFANDLQAVNFLDAISICVSGNATLRRPKVG